jgi:5-methyltetrahydropteroyltriglutamate--homocysteine methyltransferase
MHSHSSSQAEGKGIPVDHHITAAIEAMNLAIEGLPKEKIRLHLCWGNYAGPHHHDIELIDLVDDVIKANVGFLYVEAANPRHEHEWEIWKEKKLPDDMALIAGMIDTLTNHVEHPRLIAQRLGRFASVLGRERVIAGTDCGFSTFVGWSGCDPAVSWLKLEALAQGAAIASDELFRA